MSRTVSIHEAKTHLSRLLLEVAQGEEVIIAKAGRPVARLLAFEEATPKRHFGKDRGEFTVPEDFDESLPPEVLAGFE